MFYQKRWIAMGLAIAVPLLAYQDWLESSPQKNDPAKVERFEKDGTSRITLTPRAAERLGIQTVAVREENMEPPSKSGKTNGAKSQKIIPYSAVLYDERGLTWAYISPEPMVFIRHRISIGRINGDLALLTEGPPLGTQVVTVGVSELYGIEKGIGK